MAEKNLSSIIKSAASQLAGLIRRSVGLSSDSAYNPEEDVEEMRRMVLRIRAAIDYEEERDVKYEAVQLWLEKFKELAYDAEDIVDEYDFEVLRSKVEGQNKMGTTHKQRREEVWNFITSTVPIPDDFEYMTEEYDFNGPQSTDEGQKQRREEVWSLITSTVSIPNEFEDMMEEYDFKVLQPKVQEGQNNKQKREEARNLITSPVSVPDDFEDRIRKTRKMFDEITHDQDALLLPEEDREKPFGETTPFVNESAVHGREKDKEKVIEWLLAEDGSTRQSVSVLPIIGMGGIGKTTLAQLVYNDRRVCQYFSQRGWVCVSENFDVNRLLKEIYQSLTKESGNQMKTDILGDNLRRELRGKSFLLILDDVWNEKLDLWESVKAPLCGVGVVKIIVTTRHASVARIMQTSQLVHRLDFLPEDECWLLFRNRAFEGRDLDACKNLTEIGKKIVRKCGGLPLAVKTLGGLLRFETAVERWTDVLGSALWELDEQEVDILPALKLSYIRLPAHLKRCFMYCSLFPKEYWFQKDEIIRLWMSQGLIRSEGTQQLEDIGNAYFEELNWRSFFQMLERKDDRKVMEMEDDKEEVYVMHDLLHDLAESVARQECHKIDGSLGCNVDSLTEYFPRGEYHKIEGCLGCNAPKRIRHLGFYFSSSFLHLNLLEKCRDLRTLLVHPHQHKREFRVEIGIGSLQNLTYLRTLDLSWCGITELPDSIGSLKHLRYLCLRESNISRLPDSVCRLYNLLTLDLYKGSAKKFRIKELPKDMKNLINLRHLILGAYFFCLPPGIGQITSLRTLSGFEVGIAGQHCGVRELKNLVHLRGSLAIDGLENLASLEDATDAKMDDKEHLESLSFGWDQEPVLANLQGLACDEYVKQTLENLRPHTNLKELNISGYRGSESPSWLCDPNFSKMVHVNLDCFRPSFTFLPPLGQLPSLRSLKIGQMEGVRSVGREFCVGYPAAAYGFPSLERLEFCYMPEWVEWHGVEDGDFPCLSNLSILHCNKLTSLPARGLLALKNLVIVGCEGLGALPALTSLATLHLESADKLCTSFSSSNLLSLQELTVSMSIKESITLRHGGFPLLRKLSFSACTNLRSIRGLHSLTSLEELYITACQKLRFSGDDQPPPVLQRIEVFYCPGLRQWCQRQGIQYN